VDLFPNACFVHIVRDPYVVYPSTLRLWRSLYRAHGLQTPSFEGLEEHVLSTFTLLYRKLEEGRRLVSPNRFYELKYEDLVRDPVNQMERLYAHLDLGGFGEYVPRLEKYLTTIKGYETNRYELDQGEREKLRGRWGEVIRQYGYDSA
jgi:hypothetical protein